MTLLLSLLSDPSIIDRKNHTVLESCIKLVLFLPTIPTCIKSWMNLRHNPSCAEALLSSGVSTNNKELCEKSFLLVYNLMWVILDKFSNKLHICILPKDLPEEEWHAGRKQEHKDGWDWGEKWILLDLPNPLSVCQVISGFLSNGRKSLLAHPLAETFLHLKWLVKI